MIRGERSRAPLEYDADEVSKGTRMRLNGALEDLCLTVREPRLPATAIVQSPCRRRYSVNTCRSARSIVP
jgi:hypothetical protein